MLDRTEELYDFFSDDDTENDYCFLLYFSAKTPSFAMKPSFWVRLFCIYVKLRK